MPDCEVEGDSAMGREVEVGRKNVGGEECRRRRALRKANELHQMKCAAL